MSALALLGHLLNFLAPALVVALLVAGAARLFWRRSAAMGWWGNVVCNLLAGGGALLAGLWYFGRDGKMASYAALVVAIACSQWLASRAWRS